MGKKNILIMGRTAQTIELSTKLGINYIPCCSVVLMHYNGQGIWRWRHATEAIRLPPRYIPCYRYVAEARKVLNFSVRR